RVRQSAPGAAYNLVNNSEFKEIGMNRIFQLIDHEHEGVATAGGPQLGGLEETLPDGQLLDAYSRSVSSAARKVSPAVVNIEVRAALPPQAAGRPGREGFGTGSGFVFTHD